MILNSICRSFAVNIMFANTVKLAKTGAVAWSCDHSTGINWVPYPSLPWGAVFLFTWRYNLWRWCPSNIRAEFSCSRLNIFPASCWQKLTAKQFAATRQQPVTYPWRRLHKCWPWICGNRRKSLIRQVVSTVAQFFFYNSKRNSVRAVILPRRA